MDLFEEQHSQLERVVRQHGLAIAMGEGAPTRDLDVIGAALEQGNTPWIPADQDGRRLVTVELRDPDDSASDVELLEQAREYGFPDTAILKLGSGYLGLLYWTTKFSDRSGHIFFEDWCSLNTVPKRHLAPGACINGNPGYVSISDDQIAELPPLAVERWAAEQRAIEAHDAEIRTTVATPNKPRIYFEDFSDLRLGEERPELVEGLLDHGGLSVWVGAPKGGKTANLVYLAYAVASGTQFHGHKANPGLVLYLAAEGGNSTRKRFMAIRAHYGIAAQAVPLRLVPCPVDLASKQGDITQIVPLIRQAEKDCGQKAVLVIVDTLARATPGMDENDAKGMGEFVANMDYIRAQTGAHVAVVHHFGKDKTKGGRGSSSLPAAVDSEFEVAEQTITNTLQRDRERAEPMGFGFAPVVLGRQRDGRDIVSVVAVPNDLSAREAFTPKPIPANAQNALRILQDLSMNGRKVPLSEWREEFVTRRYPQKRDTGRKQFGRAVKDLETLGNVSKIGGFYATRD